MDEQGPAGGELSESPWERRCPDCAGTGTAAGAQWAEWDRSRDRLRRLRDEGEGTRVLGELAAWLLAEHEATRPATARRARCGRCGGVGTVPTEAGAALLAFLRRHRTD
ncbi:hypothetical protein Q3O43_30075 (plasmid) [Rhodococcus aetherivorans]|uniref:hypothetical protein n=1 Tax=Rhodococcus aetherivorans TaxID=191292 RepID=UPI0026EC958B|nr:hypothetical protein [Rhodococcus aetherivorans]WKX02108.1 hypothetical protein Q3O43_30075 [Rhodococcus aetherivorans]